MLAHRWWGRDCSAPTPPTANRLAPAPSGTGSTTVRDAAGIPEATLHRLRHSVATFLVARGQVLQPQARLGHADAATTLREYAYALPLTDGPVADALDAHLDAPGTSSVDSRSRTPATDTWLGECTGGVGQPERCRPNRRQRNEQLRGICHRHARSRAVDSSQGRARRTDPESSSSRRTIR